LTGSAWRMPSKTQSAPRAIWTRRRFSNTPEPCAERADKRAGRDVVSAVPGPRRRLFHHNDAGHEVMDLAVVIVRARLLGSVDILGLSRLHQPGVEIAKWG
jgi:hypothetical protein